MPESLALPDDTCFVHARRTKPWRVVAALAWAATAGTLVGLAWAEVWPHRLHDSSRLWVALSYVVFMLETFTFYLGVALIPVAVFALCTRRWRLVTAAMIGVTWGVGSDTLHSVLPSLPSERMPDARLRVMSANVMYSRADLDQLLAVIDREKVDVLVLQEWTGSAERTWRPKLEARLPYGRTIPSDDAFGLAVFSRAPMQNYRAYLPEVRGVPIQAVDVELATVPASDFRVKAMTVRIVNVHVLPPVGLSMFREQREQTMGLARYSERVQGARGEPDFTRGLVMIGDLNATRRSGHLRRLREAGLRTAGRDGERALGATWPRLGSTRHWLGLELDHALISGELIAGNARVLEDIGSDHAPIIVDVAWDNGR